MDFRADLDHPTEAFVADNEEVVTRRRVTILRSVDLFIGAIHTDLNRFNEDSAAIIDIVNRGFLQLI